MGIGDPAGILEVVERGIDMFDCVLPTRLGRTGSALTWEGRLNLRNARFARDPAPLQEGCPCRACSGFSRAYLRHLVNQQELLGLVLLSEHNVRFLLDLTAGARAPSSAASSRPSRRTRSAGSKPDRRPAACYLFAARCAFPSTSRTLYGSGPGWLRQPARRLGKWIQSSSSSS